MINKNIYTTVGLLLAFFILYNEICYALGFNPSQIEVSRKRIVSGFKDSTLKQDVSFASMGNIKFKEILDQIKGMESKIASEKSIVSDLERKLANASNLANMNAKNLSSLSQKFEDMESSVDLDANYWNTSESCGGVVIAQTGQISYSGIIYRLSQSKFSCVWTIRTNYRSKVKVYFPGLTPLNTIVTEFFINENGTHTTKLTSIVPAKKYLFNGPLILIATPANQMSSSAIIVFEGIGKNVHQDTEFRHYHYKGYEGNFNLDLNQSYYSFSNSSLNEKRKKIFTTVVINTDKSNLAELTMQPTKSCTNTSSILIQTGIDIQYQTYNENCCTSGCPQQRYYSMDGWFASSYSSPFPQNNLRISWRSWWNQSDSIDKCGGVLMGKTGKISYKKSLNYMNNERCIWIINPFPKSAVRFLHLTSGMESTYDHLVVTEIDKEVVTSTELSSTLLLRHYSSNFTGRLLLVTFYSDISIVRQGFELSWEAIGPPDLNRSLENEQILHNKLKDSLIQPLTLTNKGFVLYVVSNSEKDASSLNMTVVKKSADNSKACDNTLLRIFGSQRGHVKDDTFNHFTSRINPCRSTTNAGSWSLASPDGIGSVFIENKDSDAQLELDVKWNYVPPESSEMNAEEKCGGVIHGLSGRLNYKLEESYDNGERCIWIIHSPTSSSIELRLLKEGFELCCDYILVNTINPETGTMNNLTTVLTRDNNTKIFNSPVLVVTFRADGSVIGKGFVLQYTGRGNANNYPYIYRIIHRDSPLGSFEYPLVESDGWDYESETSENEILILAYSSAVEPGEVNVPVIFNVSIENTVFGQDDNCKSDILNFYSTPSREGFYLAESYPKTECEKFSDGSCRNCVQTKLSQNDTTPHGFGSMYRAFIAIYKPVKSEFTNQSFHVHWDTSSGCGGVLEEEFGRIAYKLSGRYKNSEQCIWTVHSPGATKIRFLLLNNAFEACCDYIILNSLLPDNGTLSNPVFLRADSPSATMLGPVVFVTFRSDASVTGEGFALSFVPIAEDSPQITPDSTQITTDSPHITTDSSSELELLNTTTINEPLYNYYNFHGRRRNSSFSFPSHKETPGLGPNDILTFTFSPEPAKNESFLRFGSKITILNLDLGVNEESCISDKLRFYETITRSGFNMTRSFAVDAPNTACADAAQDRVWMCDNCDNITRSDQLTVSTTYPAFIAILKSSSNVGESDRKIFRMTWTDNPRVEVVDTSG